VADRALISTTSYVPVERGDLELDVIERLMQRCVGL